MSAVAPPRNSTDTERDEGPVDEPFIDYVERLFGPETADKIIEHAGGNPLYISIKQNENTNLSNIVGVAIAKEIAKTWGGNRVGDIPITYRKRDTRKKLIAKACRSQRTAGSIAKEFHVTVRYVYQIRRKLRANEGYRRQWPGPIAHSPDAPPKNESTPND